MNTSLPSDPEIIKEYLEILRAIERERQVYNPIPIKILLDAVSIETDRARHILTRIVGSDAGIKPFFKNEITVDPLNSDPYERIEQIEYIEVFDKEKFKSYISELLKLLNKSELPKKNVEEELLTNNLQEQEREQKPIPVVVLLKTFPSKLPAGTTWENVIIKFLDDENVLISVRGSEYTADYKQMGFEDSRGNKPRPNVQWVFLKVLARLNGELTIKNPQAKGTYKKQKELLSKSLQSYFKIDYDPFYPYRPSSEKAESSYKIKITLIPPPESETIQNKPREDIESGLDKEIKEYLDEEAPEVYEEQQ